MGSIDTFQCSCIQSHGLERLRYFPRQLLTADDMRLEQEYFREKQRRHNRFLHGWGVVCGLLVQVNSKEGPFALTICPGYALGPCGDEIYIPESVQFDLTPTTQLIAQPSCVSAGLAYAEENGLSIVIRYAECQSRPVRTLPEGCGCDDTSCEYSRIRDGFEIRAVAADLVTASTTTLCEIEGNPASKMPTFPPPPVSDWVTLAKINIKIQTNGEVMMLGVDNNARHMLFTTEQIQKQVIATCPD